MYAIRSYYVLLDLFELHHVSETQDTGQPEACVREEKRRDVNPEPGAVEHRVGDLAARTQHGERLQADGSLDPIARDEARRAHIVIYRNNFV